MWQHVYVWEKLRELERERPAGHRISEERQTDPMTARVMRMTGRLLRHMGESMESWATPSQPEQRREHEPYS